MEQEEVIGVGEQEYLRPRIRPSCPAWTAVPPQGVAHTKDSYPPSTIVFPFDWCPGHTCLSKHGGADGDLRQDLCVTGY